MVNYGRHENNTNPLSLVVYKRFGNNLKHDTISHHDKMITGCKIDQKDSKLITLESSNNIS